MSGWRVLVKKMGGRNSALFLDFDGTLCALRRDGNSVAVSARMLKVLAGLAALPNTRIFIVSGRSTAFLRRKISIPGVRLLGDYSCMRDESHRLAALIRRLSCLALILPGSSVEVKKCSVVFHYRRCRAGERKVLAAVRRVLPFTGKGRVEFAKKAVEFFVPGAPDKEAVVRGEMRRLPGWFSVFIGDDVSDEAGFRAADAAVCVGRRRRGAFFLRGLQEARGFLSALLAQRKKSP